VGYPKIKLVKFNLEDVPLDDPQLGIAQEALCQFDNHAGVFRNGNKTAIGVQDFFGEVPVAETDLEDNFAQNGFCLVDVSFDNRFALQNVVAEAVIHLKWVAVRAEAARRGNDLGFGSAGVSAAEISGFKRGNF
jgi:hypothetical protein